MAVAGLPRPPMRWGFTMSFRSARRHTGHGSSARCSAGRRRPILGIAAVALVAGLTACHPIDTWRSWTGANKDDPNPQTTPNSKNLAAGENEPYPNLASVPSPPIPTLTQAEFDKLTKSLVADRTDAKYNEQKLLPGISGSTEAPPPPPAPAAAAPAAATPPAHPGAGPPPSGGPAASPAGQPGKAASRGNVAPPRKPGEPPEPGPMESSLQLPTIQETPQPEATQPSPAPPRVVPQSAPAPAPIAPTAMASAAPQPTPPPPAIPVPPPPSPALKPAKAEAGPPAASTIAVIDFPAASTSLAAADRARVGEAAALFRRKPGTVHVVAYVAAAADGSQQLDNYRAALNRAQVVAKALVEAGIPVGKIATEASPARPDLPPGRVEIRFAS